ncbi:MAG: hypothetical protein ABIJ34_02075 [archaeon]
MGKILRIILSKSIGFAIFLLILFIMNYLLPYVREPVFSGIVRFLNYNIMALIVITIFLLLGDVFFEIIFPFSLPAPIFSAFGAVFLVRFFFSIFGVIDNLLSVHITSYFDFLKYIIYPIVFLVVIIVGYVKIFVRLFVPKKPKKELKSNARKQKTWEDIGLEFRQTISDFLEMLRREFKGN